MYFSPDIATPTPTPPKPVLPEPMDISIAGDSRLNFYNLKVIDKFKKVHFSININSAPEPSSMAANPENKPSQIAAAGNIPKPEEGNIPKPVLPESMDVSTAGDSRLSFFKFKATDKF